MDVRGIGYFQFVSISHSFVLCWSTRFAAVFVAVSLALTVQQTMQLPPFSWNNDYFWILIRACCTRFSPEWLFKDIRSLYNCVCSWYWFSFISFSFLSDVLPQRWRLSFSMYEFFSFLLSLVIHFYTLATNGNRYNHCPPHVVHALCIDKLIKITEKIQRSYWILYYKLFFLSCRLLYRYD